MLSPSRVLRDSLHKSDSVARENSEGESIVPDIHPTSREIPFPEPNRRGEIRCSMLSLLRVFVFVYRGLRDSLHESDSVARVNSEEGPLFPISTLLHERFRFQNQTEGGKSVSQGAAPVLDE